MYQFAGGIIPEVVVFLSVVGNLPSFHELFAH